MNITLVTATIRRDAQTILSATIPAHELEVPKLVFGEDNVQVTDEDAGSIELDPATEGERLANKYGETVVVSVFGANYKGAAAKACSSFEVAAKPKSGKALASA